MKKAYTIGVLVLFGCLVVWLGLSVRKSALLQMSVSDDKNLEKCGEAFSTRLMRYRLPDTFEEYSADTLYDGKIALLDQSGAFARRFKTSLQEGIRDHGVAFGGHYATGEWGFTGIGNEMGLVDLKTGKAYPFPYVAEFDFVYRPDSYLLVVDPTDVIVDYAKEVNCDTAPSGKPMAKVLPLYFVWNEDEKKFGLLNPEDGPPTIDSTGRLSD